jgi:hypothetical protein
MTTLGDVINDVRSKLRSYTGQHERSTYLTASITSIGVSLPVGDGTVVDQGLVEIEDELIYVESSDAGSASVPPYGRGYLGSTAAAHAADTQVIVDPAFPRANIRTAVENTLRALYPTLFAVGTTDITYSAGVTSYELPAGADQVISASWESTGGSGYWHPVKRWRVDPNAATGSFASGKAIHLADTITPGRTVRVVYAKDFDDFTDSDTTFASVGLRDSMKDVLVYGACVELLQFLEASRQQMDSVQNQERAQYVPVGSASALARQLLGLYERRVDAERKKLRQLYPPSIRFTR